MVKGYRLTQEALLDKMKERKASISLISNTLQKDDVIFMGMQITVLNNFAFNISTFERLGRMQTVDDGQFKPSRSIPTSEWMIREIHDLM